MHAPLCGRFGSNSVNVARYASLIGSKSSTKCDAQLAESNFQTRSGGAAGRSTCGSHLMRRPLPTNLVNASRLAAHQRNVG
ncbi:DUF6783 domain-containing protein [Blautia marasmi]|uniref:DUF6783 domain-containing protein n=1 Tax=Blautia marasmi TaxID=1917868 RepID=UPI002FE5621F